MKPLKHVLFHLSFFLVFIASASNAQDTLHGKANKENSLRSEFLSISFIPVPGFFNEDLLYVEYGINSTYKIGIAAGDIHPGIWGPDYLSFPTGLLPATIFRGYGARLFGKYYIKRVSHRRMYTSVQFVYKNMSYNNVTFTSQNPSQYLEQYNDYTVQNGKETVIGFDLLIGWEFLTIHDRLFFDIFTGIGMRNRVYQETIVNSYTEDPSTGQILVTPPYPLGVTTYHINYPTPVTGIKIGFNIFKK